MRIAALKLFNYANQGISSDPIYVAATVKERFIAELQKAVKKQYGIHASLNVNTNNFSIYNVTNLS